MLDPQDYYRQQADEAERQAKKAMSPSDRDAWLNMAKSWMALVMPQLVSPSGLVIDVSYPKPQAPKLH